jgi:Domain of unknown function (DUF4272)
MGLFDIFKKDKYSAPKTAQERKSQTEKYLKSLGIPFIDHLPLIEEENEVRVRTSQEVAKRILILTYLNYLAEEPEDKEKVIDFLMKQGLWESISENEIKLFKTDLTDRDRINISWRSEAIWLLLWTINKVKDLDLPIEEVQVPKMLEHLPDFMTDTKKFIETATLRTVSEILDMSDLTYRLHWATRQQELDKTDKLKLNSSIVQERHYAINWTTYYDENWDDITTDT